MRLDLPLLRSSILTPVLGVLLVVAPMAGAQPADEPRAVGTPRPVQAAGAPASRPVLLLYSEHRMPDEYWAALLAALSRDLPEVKGLVSAGDENPEFLRANYAHGVSPEASAITVYLRGDCLPQPLEVSSSGAQPLGWVSKVGGKIIPVIHVECTEIGGEISGRTAWMSHDGRKAAMSDAMARVILHEWVHVATQSAAHAAEGVSKPTFSADDLLCGDEAQVCRRGVTLNGRLQR